MASLAQLDINLTRKINHLANNHLILKFLKIITHTSDGRMYLLYAVSVPFIFPNLGMDILGLGVIGFAFQVPAYLISKNFIKRERPYLSADITALSSPPDKYSLPSGHCASSTLLVLVMNQFADWFVPFLIVWTLIIFFSRVGLGLHYVSDVIAGIALGIISFSIANNITALIF